jgi:hypothetical protein
MSTMNARLLLASALCLVVDRDANGKVIFDSRTLPAPLVFPLTMYKEPEAPHSVENLSKTITIHLVRVEMKN